MGKKTATGKEITDFVFENKDWMYSFDVFSIADDVIYPLADLGRVTHHTTKNISTFKDIYNNIGLL